MVCKLGRGRMAAMVRLLAGGNHTEITTEEATHEKIAVQTIHREFHEADEANLLEEEDMHVFDSRPLMDPLHLVCCNTCKKPVKASQYAAHAARCRSLNSTEDIGLEIDGGSGPKKPPRNGRKKLQTAHDNQGTTVAEQEKSDSIDGDNVSASESNLDGHNRMVSSLSKEAKRRAAFVDHIIARDGCGVSPGSTNYSADAPAPLATKIYHSQGNHRLRAALAHLYREAVTKEHGCDFSNPRLVQGITMQSTLSSRVSSNKLLHAAPKDDFLQAKKDTYPASALQNPDQILAQSSELCLGGTSGGCPSSVSINQFREANSPRPGLTVDTAPMGMARTKLHPSPYSFPGSSGFVGATLGAMQQPSGSVPVV